MTNRPKSFDDKLLKYLPKIKKMAKRLFPSGSTNDKISTKNEEYQADLIQSSIERALEKWESPKDGFSNWLGFIVLAEYNKMRTAIKHGGSEDIDDTLTGAISVDSNQETLILVSEAFDLIESKLPFPQEQKLYFMGLSYSDIGLKMGVSKQEIARRVKINETKWSRVYGN